MGLGLKGSDLFPDNGGMRGDHVTSPQTSATVQPSGGCTLQQYAAAKRLPSDFLRGLGLSDVFYLGQPGSADPHLDASAIERSVQFRLALAKSAGGDNRFRFKSGHKPIPYGLGGSAQRDQPARVTLVEGASDCQTLWYHDLPALEQYDESRET